MQLLTLDESTRIDHPTVLTMGNFDGVHLGHRILLEKLVSRANQLRARSVVVTFEPHTRQVIQNEPVARLSTLEEKQALLESYGIDYLVVIPFTTAFSSLHRDHFRENVLAKQLNVKEFIAGEGHRFGRKNDSDEKNLSFDDEKKHFSSIKIKLYGENSGTANSTEIRKYLSEGQISDAVNMLGHPYLVLANRVRGKQIGTELGYPTLNFMTPPSQKSVPPSGVYVAEVEFNSTRLKGCLYYGDCPTFGDREIHFEFFALDVIESEPEVGEMCRIWIHQFIRREIAFAGKEELTAQIEQDVKMIKNYFVKE